MAAQETLFNDEGEREVDVEREVDPGNGNRPS